MPDTFDSDPNTLPPLTQAIRLTWPIATTSSAEMQAVWTNAAARKVLDAIHSLETRIIALGG